MLVILLQIYTIMCEIFLELEQKYLVAVPLFSREINFIMNDDLLIFESKP